MTTENTSRPETPIAGDAPFRLHYSVIAPLIMGKGVGNGSDYTDAYAKKQRVKYRDLYLKTFKEIAEMRD